MKVSNDYSQSNTLMATVCASAVMEYFGVYGTTYNKRTKQNVWMNTLRRNGYSVRSRRSKLHRDASVGGSRNKLRIIAEAEPQIRAFIIKAKGHVLLLDREGETIIDTAPRKRDRRKVVGLHAVW